MATDNFTALRRLTVWKDSTHVGVLESDALGRLRFRYVDAVLDRPDLAVSVRLPVRRQPWDDQDALPCFENLLPESDIRTHIAQATHMASKDVSGLLGVIGGECAGALTLWPDGELPPEPPVYEACTQASLTNLFTAAGSHSAALQQRTRQSMSGAQDKVVLLRTTDNRGRADPAGASYQLPLHGAPGTVLCKRDRSRYPGLVANEIACMSLMHHAGVPTASHTVNALAPDVYETARFDRVVRADGRVQRLHAEDGCQITGYVSIAKYADPRGPSFQDLVAALRRYSADAATDTELLLRWAVANVVIGNRDAHAKNVSILHHADGTIRLAPAYDVICTLVYPIDTKLALPFGGTRHTSAFTRGMWRVVAREFRVTDAFAREVAADVLERVLRSCDDALHASAAQAGAHEVLTGIRDTITAQGASLTALL